MKYILSLLCAGSLCLIACNSGNKKDNPASDSEVMTSIGPWQARFKEIRSKVTAIENDHLSYRKYRLSEPELKAFSSEYPFWEQITVYMSEEGIRKARLSTSNADQYRLEEFYFDDNELFYAQINDEDSTAEDGIFHGNQYFFMQQKLIFALNEKNDTLWVDEDTVAIIGIDLWKEAQQIKSIISRKDLEF